MGIADLLGLAKKEPFRVPAEAVALRTRIAAEMRENFPNLARFREMQKEADRVYEQLEVIGADRDHGEQARKVLEDLRRKMDELAQKIGRNQQDARSESGEDYVEDNLAYLERKSVRNSAKTLFTEFLEVHEKLMRAAKGAGAEASPLSVPAQRLFEIATTLSRDFFAPHGQDREIRELRNMAAGKIAELNDAYGAFLAGMDDSGERGRIAGVLAKLAALHR